MLTLLLACVLVDKSTDTHSTETGPVEDTAPPEWGYGADDGPETWAEGYPDCGGSAQSPINLDTEQITYAELPSLTLDYADTTLSVTNTGEGIKWAVAEGSSLSLDGVSYPLKQFHVHTPSEHLMNGIQPEVEMHLVHQLDDAYVVIGLFINGDDSNPGFEESFATLGWDRLPAVGETLEDPEVSFNLVDLLQPIILAEGFERVSYAGSLTTPPCTEAVTWVISPLIPTIPTAQLAQLHALYTDNHRPVQDQGARVVTWDTTP